MHTYYGEKQKLGNYLSVPIKSWEGFYCSTDIQTR